MEEYTLEVWNEKSMEERLEHNCEVFKSANYDISKIETQDTPGKWCNKLTFTITPNWQNRLKPILSPSEQFTKLIEEKGFKAGSRVIFTGDGSLKNTKGTIVRIEYYNGSFNMVIRWDTGIEFNMNMESKYHNISLYKPTYRPFKDDREFEPFRDKWVACAQIDKEPFNDDVAVKRVIHYDKDGIWVYCGRTPFYTYEQALKELVFQDTIDGERTPFGVE